MASTIKVDNIQDQCGSAVVTKCGASKTLTVTTTKADNYQAADGGNIINQCGTTITLGASGDTIQLACGATQSGFGRSGSVNWDTTAKTAGFTAVSGNGYFVNTTSGAITVTLPASPSAGDIVSLSDYAQTWGTNNVTVARNSSNIQGNGEDATLTTSGKAVTFVYVDVTKGWIITNSGSQDDATFGQFITATGGCITTCGDYKIHKFTSPGTFTVCSVGNCAGSTTVDYLVVAGGGGGGTRYPGGGGAGGLRYSFPNPATGGFPVTATAYPITIGGGGSGAPATPNDTTGPPVLGSPGSISVFSSITSTGGGGGGGGCNMAGLPGGSGGGGGLSQSGGSGNSPPVSPPQGNPGAPWCSSAKGGGHAQPGSSGGAGSPFTISGSDVTYSSGANPNTAPAGAANTGDGGGGANFTGTNPPGNAGGSGIVIIRYKYQ